MPSLTFFAQGSKFVSMNSTDRTKNHFMRLQDVARVQPGYLSRTSVRPASTGTHRLLQARDVSSQRGLCLDSVVRFIPLRNPELYQVSRGDILLAARGQDYRAHLIDMDLADVLASSVFYIVRPCKELVLPGYLTWWLNQPDMQAALENGSCGTGIGYLARPLLEALDVVVPPLEVQRLIADTMNLWRRQQSIRAQIDQKREQLIQSTCRQAVGLDKE